MYKILLESAGFLRPLTKYFDVFFVRLTARIAVHLHNTNVNFTR